MRKISVFILVGGILAGCVSSQPGADKVIMTSNPAQVAGCRLLGQITVNQANWWGPGQMAKDSATDLRNKAIAKGGTHVLTGGPSAIMQAAVMQTGDIYKC